MLTYSGTRFTIGALRHWIPFGYYNISLTCMQRGLNYFPLLKLMTELHISSSARRTSKITKWVLNGQLETESIHVNIIMIISLCQQIRLGVFFSFWKPTNQQREKKAHHAMINERERRQEMIFLARLVAFPTFFLFFFLFIFILLSQPTFLFLSFCLFWLLLYGVPSIYQTRCKR